MKALFFPSYQGGGFGHVGRSLALAEGLERCGWETVFALGGAHAERVRNSGRKVAVLHRPPVPAAQGVSNPAYTTIPDMSYQLIRDGLVHQWAIRNFVSEQLKVVRQIAPDVLIADVWPLAGVLAHLSGLPLVQIVRSIVHPAAPQLIWWQERPAGLVSPDPRPVINPLLEGWGMAPIQQAEDLLAGDLYLVPSIPILDPLPAGLQATHYTGPFVRETPPSSGQNGDHAWEAWLDSQDAKRPVVYVTAGGGAELVSVRLLISMLVEALGSLDVAVLLSTGGRLSPRDLPALPANIRVEAWVPGPQVIARSSLVVYPGGYGTTMELVRAGVPGLVIPFHSEQESNARRLEAAGAARVLFPGKTPALTTGHAWPGGRFTTQVYPESSLSAACLRERIVDALADSSLRAAALRLQQAAALYRGPVQAAELIESFMASRTRPQVRGWDRLSWRQKISLSL